jgi:hypothetical protein
MKTLLFIPLIFLITFLISSFTPLRTGPSSAYYKITPIAYSDSGAVLCRTQSEINSMGAARMMQNNFGYLVVSANGIWEEVFYDSTPGDMDYNSYEKFRNKFYGPVNLEKSTGEMNALIKKYNINHKIAVTGKNTCYWNKTGIYDKENTLIALPVQQRSINGLTSIEGRGNKIFNAYEVKNVLFFDNSWDETRMGAYFKIKGDFGDIDWYTVTGICFVKSNR